MSDIEILQRMAVGLALGLVIGAERGWHVRDAPEGTRVAGIRTFALFGLTGSLIAVLGADFLPLVAAAVALGLVGLIIALRLATRADGDVGATTEVASITTFALGALAGLGYSAPAIAGAVVSALLLGVKPILHRWLRAVNERELLAALQLLLISAVVLPLLPDQGFGPFGTLNPYRLWWMVVLTAGVSFAGYVAVKLMGASAGVLFTGFAGGLVASTATTLALLRRAKTLNASLHGSVAAGITAATATMMVRVVVLATVIYPPLWIDLVKPIGAMAAVAIGATIWLWRTGPVRDDASAIIVPRNPLDLRAALGFACILVPVIILVETARSMFGSAGVYVLAALSALADVDAITLSLAGQAQKLLPRDVAVTAVVIAVAVNTCVKVGLAVCLGPVALMRQVSTALVAVLAAGAVAWWWPWLV